MLAGQGSGRTPGQRLFYPKWVPAGASAFWDFAGNRAWVDMEPVALADAISFERAGTALWAPSGTYLEVPTNTLRRADGIGALLEVGRENLLPLLRCDTSYWYNSNDATITPLDLDAVGIFPGVQVISGGQDAGRIRPGGGYNATLTAGSTYIVSAYYRLGTSGRVRVMVRDSENSLNGWVSGPPDGLIAQGEVAETISNVADQLLSDGLTRRLSFLFVPVMSSTSVDVGIGPDSAVVGEDIIALGAQVEEIGYGEPASATTPIITSGATEARAADELTLPLPSGAHDLTMTFDDGSTAPLASGVSGSLLVDPALATRTLKHITARPA